MTTETAQDEFHISVGYLPIVDLTFFGHLEHVGETSMSVLAVFFQFFPAPLHLIFQFP